MKELTGSAKIAYDAINLADNRPDNDQVISAWFVLAYAALRILANIADALSNMDR